MSDPRSFLQKMQDDLVPSLIAGSIGVASAHFLMGVDLSNNISLFDISLPSYIAIGGTIALSNALAYASHDFVLEKIPAIQNSGFATYENKFLAPILAGVSCYILLREGISTDVSLINSFLLGGGSSIVGRYSFDTYNQASMGK